MKDWILRWGVLSLAFLGAANARGAGTWKSDVPAIAQQSQAWVQLVDALRKGGMPYGAMAASARMLTFFPDLPTKEAAYHAVIELIDQGYPFSENSLFVSGDLEAQGDVNFVNSYNLIKYVLNHEHGMDRWAQEYYGKMDGGESFSKYQFYLAIQAYAQGKLDDSVDRLKKILAADPGEGSGALAIRTARTLARIDFEKKQYDKSLDIYTSFLLKLNPIIPSDWLEAAWNEYYLKRYPEALGMLYNLESRAAGPVLSLEKYALRALIYRENCAVDNAQMLISSFDRDFGPALLGLKDGESPRKYPILSQVETGEGSPYRRLTGSMLALQKESGGIDLKLPPAQRALAHYLYDTESQMLQAEVKGVSDIALDRAAEELVETAEHLKFLKYDVAREKYDPDQVFRASSELRSMTAAAPAPNDSQVKWPQRDDFWRTERLSFKGEIKQQCHD